MGLALGFAVVGVLFFRAASPQASAAAASTNTLIALQCTSFNSATLQCDQLQQWDNNGNFSPYTPKAGTALVITDMECGGLPATVPGGVECNLGQPNWVIQTHAYVSNSSRFGFQLTTHLTSGIVFTGFPGIFLINVKNTADTYVYLQGYLIQTSS